MLSGLKIPFFITERTQKCYFLWSLVNGQNSRHQLVGKGMPCQPFLLVIGWNKCLSVLKLISETMIVVLLVQFTVTNSVKNAANK